MFHDVVREKCGEAGFSPNVTFESYQWELLFEMVADNQGICILPKPLVDKFNNTRVHQIHLKEPEFPWTLSLIYRKDKFITVPDAVLFGFVLQLLTEGEGLANWTVTGYRSLPDRFCK